MRTLSFFCSGENMRVETEVKLAMEKGVDVEVLRLQAV